MPAPSAVAVRLRGPGLRRTGRPARRQGGPVRGLPAVVVPGPGRCEDLLEQVPPAAQASQLGDRSVIPAEAMSARAAALGQDDEAVLGAIVFGSVAAGTATAESDLDLLLIAQPGRRDELWDRREDIARQIHGDAKIVYAREPSWQHKWRHQSWTAGLLELDMTVDEGTAAADDALAGGYKILVDKGEVAAGLAANLSSYRRPVFDVAEYDGIVWTTLDYLHGRIRHGEYWAVRFGLAEILNSCIVPALGATGLQAHTELSGDLLELIHAAAPASGDPPELQRSLLATAELWELALTEWALRCDQPRPYCELAPLVLNKLRG